MEKRKLTLLEIWSGKSYDPKHLENLTRIISAFEKDGSRINQFRKPERSDVEEGLLTLFEQPRHGMSNCVVLVS